jgi:hypothetical protein
VALSSPKSLTSAMFIVFVGMILSLDSVVLVNTIPC